MTAKGEFQGFPKEMFEFFMAISFNNNTEFFEENRKLLAVLVTASGYVGDKIVNLLTSADIPLLIRMLEE